MKRQLLNKCRPFIVGLFVMPVLFGFTGSGQAQSRAVTSLLEMRRDRVIVQDFDLSCGAAALATLLTYQLEDPITEREVALGLISREEYIENPRLVQIRFGFSLLDLKRFVDSRGYQGVGYGGMTFQDLVEKAPVLVPVDFNGYNHFVIFRDTYRGRVLLADPAWGNRTMPVEDFEEAWLSYGNLGHVGFVIAREDGTLPANNMSGRPDDFLILR